MGAFAPVLANAPIKATVSTAPATAARPGISALPAIQARSTVRRLRVLLGTFVAIEASGHSPSAAEAAVEAAFAAALEVDRRMHPRSAHSDLARINNAPLHTPVAVHRSTRGLLNLARRLNELTAGVFDPCLPDRPGRLADIEVRSIAAASGAPCSTGTILDGHGTTATSWTGDGAIVDGASHIVICREPVALDFGGFAKGYAVDRAIEILRGLGCTAGLVNAGGDLRVFGPRTEPILLRGPNGDFNTLELADAALAVSDIDSDRRPVEHQGYYVRCNSIARGTRYAAVIAKDATLADALVKCVLLCPKEIAARALREFGASSVGHN